MTLLLLLACGETPASDTTAIHPVAEMSACVAPQTNPVLTSTVYDLVDDRSVAPITSPDALVHMVSASTRGDRVLLGGTPGLRVMEMSHALPVELVRWNNPQFFDLRFVSWLDDERALISSDYDSAIVHIGEDVVVQKTFRDVSVSDMVETDDGFLLTTRDGRLLLLDGNSSSTVFEGLVNPTSLVVVDGVALVGEGEFGVTAIDLGTGRTTGLRTASRPTDLVAFDDVLYASLGSDGLETFDISDPASPTRLGALPLPGTAVAMLRNQHTLWVATIDGVAAVDVQEARAPFVAGATDLDEYTLALAPLPEGVLAIDWSRIARMGRLGQGPVLDLSHDRLTVEGQGSVRLRNLGAEPLALTGMTAQGLEAGSLPPVLQPGEVTWLGVEVAADATEGSLCIASDDPSQPTVDLEVSQGDGLSLAIGTEAPDFVLYDLDGNRHELSAMAGEPVVLVFFATWCPICAPELVDLQSRDLDATVWLIAPMDDPATLDDFMDAHGIDLPVLVDPNSSVFDRWQQHAAFDQTIFPQNWVVDGSGTIVYGSNRYEPEALEMALAE